MSGPVQAQALAARVAAGERQAVAQPAQAQRVAVDPQARLVIDTLFDSLKGVHPAWRQAWPTPADEGAAKREWLAAFMQAGIRQVEQIQHGIRMARQSREAFVPAVGVFVGWCFAPEAFRLPSLEQAYAQAMRNTHPAQAADARWSHDAIYHAAVAAGFSNLQRLQRELGLQLFDKHYQAVCHRLGRGEVLPAAPVAALPAPARKGSPEVARAALAAMRARVRGAA